MAYNPDCKQNPYSNQVTGTSCLAMLYDTDGFITPNTSGKDLRSINASVGCNFKSGGTCFGTPFNPSPLTKAECEQLKGDLGISGCYFDNDYWAGAVKTCGGVTKMASRAELTALSQYIYGEPVSSTGSSTNLNWDRDKLEKIGLHISSTNYLYVWFNEEFPDGVAAGRNFNSIATSTFTAYRYVSNYKAICIVN